jgi:hypothetical protein
MLEYTLHTYEAGEGLSLLRMLSASGGIIMHEQSTTHTRQLAIEGSECMHNTMRLMTYDAN